VGYSFTKSSENLSYISKIKWWDIYPRTRTHTHSHTHNMLIHKPTFFFCERQVGWKFRLCLSENTTSRNFDVCHENRRDTANNPRG